MCRLKIAKAIFPIFLLILIAGCDQVPSLRSFVTVQSEPTPETVLSGTADFSNVKSVAQSYLDAWTVEDYSKMYSLLTSISKDAVSEEEFVQHYLGVAIEAALSEVDTEILSVMINPDTAQVRYRVSLISILVGEITRNTVMNLHQERGQWRVEWDDTLVLPELQGGNFLVMDRSGYVLSSPTKFRWRCAFSGRLG